MRTAECNSDKLRLMAARSVEFGASGSERLAGPCLLQAQRKETSQEA